MNHEDFTAQVKRLGEFDAGETALTATRATLETLCDHLAGNAPAKLAAQLPEGIAEFITDYKSDENAEGERFGVDEFVERTAKRLGTSDLDAVRAQAKAVLAVVREAVSDGEFEKVRGTLPDDYDALFDDSETADN